MKTVHKFPMMSLNKRSRCTIHLPVGAQIVKIGMQHQTITLWALVDTDEDHTEERVFVLYGTGHLIKEPVGNHLDSLFDGPFVWHIFEEK